LHSPRLPAATPAAAHTMLWSSPVTPPPDHPQVLSRRRGFTVETCIGAIDASKETPQFQGLSPGEKVGRAGTGHPALQLSQGSLCVVYTCRAAAAGAVRAYHRRAGRPVVRHAAADLAAPPRLCRWRRRGMRAAPWQRTPTSRLPVLAAAMRPAPPAWTPSPPRRRSARVSRGARGWGFGGRALPGSRARVSGTGARAGQHR